MLRMTCQEDVTQQLSEVLLVDANELDDDVAVLLRHRELLDVG